MDQTASMRGSATVLSIEKGSYPQTVTVRVDSGDLNSPRVCELTCAADGEAHDIQYASTIRMNAGEALLVVLRRRIVSARELAVGDVVTWDHAPHAKRAEVHGYPLGDFVQLASYLDDDDVHFPASIAGRLTYVKDWCTSPWFDRWEVDTPAPFARTLNATFRVAYKRSEPVACAMYVQGLRRILHTIDDVRGGRVPAFYRRFARMLDKHDPMSRLNRIQREWARPIAEELENQTLVAMLQFRMLREPLPVVGTGHPPSTGS